jgi:hypothetical protein
MPLPAPLESNPSFESGGAKAPAINLPGAFRFAGLGCDLGAIKRSGTFPVRTARASRERKIA